MAASVPSYFRFERRGGRCPYYGGGPQCAVPPLCWSVLHEDRGREWANLNKRVEAARVESFTSDHCSR